MVQTAQIDASKYRTAKCISLISLFSCRFWPLNPDSFFGLNICEIVFGKLGSAAAATGAIYHIGGD